MPDGATQSVSFFRSVLADAGVLPQQGSRVLDFGCGEGAAVDAWRASGYDAYGCDVIVRRCDERLRAIEFPYHLPFPSASFDLVVSDQVLEHVRDHEVAFAEIRRVLKPRGVSIHLFPSRWTIIEPHVHVPLAGVFQGPFWLGLWARLGVRNEFQAGLGWREVRDLNARYLTSHTNYIGRANVRDVASRWFDELEYIDSLSIKHGKRTRRLYAVVRHAPLAATAYGKVRSSLLLLRLDRDALRSEVNDRAVP